MNILKELLNDDVELLIKIESGEVDLVDIYRDIILYKSFRKLQQLNLVYGVQHISLTADAYKLLKDIEAYY